MKEIIFALSSIPVVFSSKTKFAADFKKSTITRVNLLFVSLNCENILCEYSVTS